MNAPLIKLEHLQLTKNESQVMHNALFHTILSVIVHYGGEEFKQQKEELDKNVPKSDDIIAVHKSKLHPLVLKGLVLRTACGPETGPNWTETDRTFGPSPCF